MSNAAFHANTSPMMVAFRNTIERLETALIQEAESLRAHRFGDLKEFNDRKSRGLLEVTRAARSITPALLQVSDRASLLRLRTRLDENQRLLLAHLNAAREITAVIAQAMEASESDGTYTNSASSRTS